MDINLNYKANMTCGLIISMYINHRDIRDNFAFWFGSLSPQVPEIYAFILRLMLKNDSRPFEVFDNKKSKRNVRLG